MDAGGEKYAHVIGFDDAPFARTHRGDVLIVGACFSARTLAGVISGKVRRDGVNATDSIARSLEHSQFAAHAQLIMLQGIAMAGFNVVDIDRLRGRLGLPVLVVARREPDLAAMRAALLDRVRGGVRKWRIIERTGPMEPLEGVYVQRSGLSLDAAARLLRYEAVNGRIPEPLRVAHLVAGGVVTGCSRGRV